MVYWSIRDLRINELADVAALYIESDTPSTHFSFFGYSAAHELNLGDNAVSFGYPALANERPLKLRVMRGHLQSLYEVRDDPFLYDGIELPFPSFPGQSGSPVVLDSNSDEAIGIVTQSIRYTSEQAEEQTEAHWTIAANLISLAEWVTTL